MRAAVVHAFHTLEAPFVGNFAQKMMCPGTDATRTGMPGRAPQRADRTASPIGRIVIALRPFLIGIDQSTRLTEQMRRCPLDGLSSVIDEPGLHSGGAQGTITKDPR
jgi:hypothetical protein